MFNGENGLLVSPPSKPDNSSRSGYRRTARITNERIQEVLDNAAFEGCNAAVEKLQPRAAAIRSAPQELLADACEYSNGYPNNIAFVDL